MEVCPYCSVLNAAQDHWDHVVKNHEKEMIIEANQVFQDMETKGLSAGGLIELALRAAANTAEPRLANDGVREHVATLFRISCAATELYGSQVAAHQRGERIDPNVVKIADSVQDMVPSRFAQQARDSLP